MKHRIRRFIKVVLMVAVAGCAGLSRECSAWQAESFASDWIVVQLRFDGTVTSCWKLANTSISNEDKSDGIYWKDGATGHLVHISGWYNRVQVVSGKWSEASTLLGVDSAKCGNGVYKP